jgi:hypothetical protein
VLSAVAWFHFIGVSILVLLILLPCWLALCMPQEAAAKGETKDDGKGGDAKSKSDKKDAKDGKESEVCSVRLASCNCCGR